MIKKLIFSIRRAPVRIRKGAGLTNLLYHLSSLSRFAENILWTIIFNFYPFIFEYFGIIPDVTNVSRKIDALRESAKGFSFL